MEYEYLSVQVLLNKVACYSCSHFQSDVHLLLENVVLRNTTEDEIKVSSFCGKF